MQQVVEEKAHSKLDTIFTGTVKSRSLQRISFATRLTSRPIAKSDITTVLPTTKYPLPMKNFLLSLTLSTAIIASASLAQQPNDELARLHENYGKAIERATAPITATYITELKKLIEKHTKAGNLDAALAARTALESVNTVATSQAPFDGAASTSPPVAAIQPAVTNAAGAQRKLSTADKKRIESYFAGKTWATFDADGNKTNELQYFARNGTGARKVGDVVTTALKWKLMDDGTLNVTQSGYEKDISFTSAERATQVVHAAPPKGDVIQELKVTTETIPGVK